MSDYLIVVLVAGLATARLWRLIAVDAIAMPFRNMYYKVLGRWPDFAEDLISCPFCLGFWLSIPVTISGLLWADNGIWWWLAVGPFAANYLSAQLNAWLDVKVITDNDGEIPAKEEAP